MKTLYHALSITVYTTCYMKESICTAIKHALEDLNAPDVLFTVLHPANANHGDYASNVAIAASTTLSMSSMECAKCIKERIGSIEHIDRIEIIEPGFLNFFLAPSFFQQIISTIAVSGEKWGRVPLLEGKQVLLEYGSPNLFKPLHVGNLVGTIVGESLARLCSFGGAKVIRVMYPSDIGLTIAKGVWGVQKTGGNPNDIHSLGEAYRVGSDAYDTNPNSKKEIEVINEALYVASDSSLTAISQEGKKTSLHNIIALFKTLSVTFDSIIFESEAAPIGLATASSHIKDGIFEDDDGAIIFRGERHDLHTRVFINSQGLPTYEAKEIGNFVIKQERYPNWDLSFIVTGSEQRDYFAVIKKVLGELFPAVAIKNIEHISTGFLTLLKEKMSSRKGNVLTGESLLTSLREEALERVKETRSGDITNLTEHVAVAALKYQILRQNTGSNIVFDQERALSFDGDSGPYLQYTFARTVSVLAKANKLGIVPSTAISPDTPYPIERLLYQFEEVITQAIQKRSPHYVISYLTTLAASFNTFYATERIADTTDSHAGYKLKLTQSVGQTLENGLWVLGIDAPKQM